MTKKQSGFEGERWWIQGPTHDETLHSITERAWRCYGAEGHVLRRRVWPRATAIPGDDVGLDGLPARELCILARAVGAAPRELFNHRLPDHPMLLQEDQRRVFCPSCWSNDAKAGQPPSFRRSWMGVFTLNCSVHGRPLHWAPNLIASGKIRMSIQPAWPRRAEDRDLVQFITRFALILQKGLEGHAPWPNTWHGDACSARALLMRVAVNLGRVREYVPFTSIGHPAELSTFIGVPARPVEPVQTSPWECVRALGPPEWRRAALWMTAFYVISRPQRLRRPPGLPAEPFAALDAQWDDGLFIREGRRTQRYRKALLGMTRAFPIGLKGKAAFDRP